jgi:hypothetical protein
MTSATPGINGRWIEAKGPFNDAVADYVNWPPLRFPQTRESYTRVFTKHLRPRYEGMTIRDAAKNRSLAEDIVNVDMLHLSLPHRRMARMILTEALDSLVGNGVIA